MQATTIHGLIYALTNTLSNLLLMVDAGDLNYDTGIEVEIEVSRENGKLVVTRNNLVISDTIID